MHKHIFYLILIIACIGLKACIKVENKFPKTSKAQLLCKSPWRLTHSSYNDSFIIKFQPCDLDNQYQAYPNGDWIMSKGKIGCYPFDTVDEHSKWAFAASETHIVFNPGTPDSSYFDIVELTEHRLWLKDYTIYKFQLIYER